MLGGVTGALVAANGIKARERSKLAISKAKQHDQREALLTIINGTNQAIFTVSSGGIIRVYNAALLSLLDTNQSLSGRRVDDILALHDQKGEPVSLFELMKQTPRFERDDLVFQFADGDAIRLHLSINKIQSAFSSQRQKDGEGYVCIARDVTKQKSLEEERDEFISVVSHELRTPLVMLQGYSEAIVDGMTESDEATKEFASIIYDESQRLSRLVNDLLDLARMEAGYQEKRIESIDAVPFANRMIKRGEETPAGPTETELLAEIRDELRRRP